MHGRDDKRIKTLVGKPEGERVLMESQCVDGKMILVWISGGKRMGHEDMDRIYLGIHWG
jgi:hypothetical protein